MVMLKTIWEKKGNRFVVVRQYYEWDIDISKSTECPGCGKNVKVYHNTYSHQCPGTLTDYPISSKKFQKNHRWHPTARWEPLVPERY